MYLMKNKIAIIASLLIIGLILSSGCVKEETPVAGGNTPTWGGSTAPAENNQTPTELNLQVGDTANTSEREVTIISAEITDGFEYSFLGATKLTMHAPDGKKFILAQVRIKNIGQNTIYANGGDFSATDSEGYSYDLEFVSGSLREDRFPALKKLYNNQKAEGSILFEIPADAKGVKILYDFGSAFTETKLVNWEVS